MIGALMIKTAFHSFQLRGKIEKRVCRTGMYKSAKCKLMDRVMAYTSIILSHRGRVRSDSDEDRAFMAFSISMTTKMDNDTVEADFDMSLANIEQPISGNLVEH
jgi:hypothetical protein